MEEAKSASEGKGPEGDGETEGRRERTESSNAGARSSSNDKEQRRMMAAASAFISDVPLVLLKLLVKELSQRNMAIVSEKKLQGKI
jgi:hypothetical protein